MNNLSPRPMPRRGFLRGMLGGSAVAVALPILDCFLSESGTALASGAPLPIRFGTWFWGLGHTPGRAVEARGATDWNFRDECAALVPFRESINFFSAFNTPLDGKPSTVHYTGWVAQRTGTVPSRSGQIPAPTLDVLVADHFSGTRFRSLELTATGNPKDSYSYRSTGSHNAAEASPLGLYSRLFGTGFSDPGRGEFRPDPTLLARKSVLSAVGDEGKAFARRVGSADRARLDEYFTAIRQLEQQLVMGLEKPVQLESCRRPSPPADNPLGLEVELVVANHDAMARLLALALACNQTRVFNMLYAQAASEVRRRGASFTHHILTHEEPPDPALGYQQQTAALNVRSMEALAVFIQTLAGVREGAGTLLDNTLVLAQTDTSVAKTHSVDGIPVMTIGRAGGRLKTGRHISGGGDPITRVGLTAMQAVGMPIEEWGTGSLRTSKPIGELLA